MRGFHFKCAGWSQWSGRLAQQQKVHIAGKLGMDGWMDGWMEGEGEGPPLQLARILYIFLQ